MRSSFGSSRSIEQLALVLIALVGQLPQSDAENMYVIDEQLWVTGDQLKTS